MQDDRVGTVGIRDLKARLSRHLKRVRAGARLVVTERGRPIAAIVPGEAPGATAEIAWAREMAAGGRAQWSAGKPRGTRQRVVLTGGPSMSDTVLEDRR